VNPILAAPSSSAQTTMISPVAGFVAVAVALAIVVVRRARAPGSVRPHDHGVQAVAPKRRGYTSTMPPSIIMTWPVM
jgi:hypothetical protein